MYAFSSVRGKCSLISFRPANDIMTCVIYTLKYLYMYNNVDLLLDVIDVLCSI